MMNNYFLNFMKCDVIINLCALVTHLLLLTCDDGGLFIEIRIGDVEHVQRHASNPIYTFP